MSAKSLTAMLQSKDKFARPSPGIIKRMAMEARNDLNRKHLAHISKASEEQRQEILRIKAEKYEKLRRGDYGNLSEKELAEVTVDVSRSRLFSSSLRLMKLYLIPYSLTASGKNKMTGQTIQATTTNQSRGGRGGKKPGRILTTPFPVRKSNTLMNWEEQEWARGRKPERQSRPDEGTGRRAMIRWTLLKLSSRASDLHMQKFCEYLLRMFPSCFR